MKLSPRAGAGVWRALAQRCLLTLSGGAVGVYGPVSSAVTGACKDRLGLALPSRTGWWLDQHVSVLTSGSLWRLLVCKTQARYVIRSGHGVITLTCLPYGTWSS